MRIFILLSILPILSFAQSKKTIFLESGTSVYTPFQKQSFERSDIETYNSDLTYTYKTTPGFYIKAGVELGPKTPKRFNVTIPVSIGYKAFNTETVKTGSSSGCFTSFYGIQSTKTTDKYASLMIGPKFNFNMKRFTIYTALNMNVDLFLNSKSTIATNNESIRIVQEDFKIESVRSDDISFNSSLKIGADYRLTEHFQVGVSVDAYFSRLNNLIDKSGPYFFNYNYGKRSSIINGGVKLAYNF